MVTTGRSIPSRTLDRLIMSEMTESRVPNPVNYWKDVGMRALYSVISDKQAGWGCAAAC